MKLRNKLLLKWRAPHYMIKHLKKEVPLTERLKIQLHAYLRLTVKCLLLVSAAWVIFRLVRQDGFLISWIPIATGVGAGLLLSLVSWVSSLAPSEVQVREKNIVIVEATGASVIPYKDVQSCTLREVNLGGQRFEVLELKYWDGEECTLEIANNLKGDEILERLRQQGLQVRRA
jgi:hypothetical protein